MIINRELFKRPVKLSEEHASNIATLLLKLNKFRLHYGKPLRVTSGYRSMDDHLAIYAAKGITDQSKIPMKSNHLFGLAADVVPIEDDIKHLHDWVLDNISLMEEIGLWFEVFSATPTWCHIQCVPPKSGKRFFLP